MDINEFMDYHKWADNLLIDTLKPISEEDFNQKSGEIRSIRELVEHYLTTYDNLYLPPDKKDERMVKVSKMTKEQLLAEIPQSQKKFQDFALKLDDKVPLQLTKDKSISLFKYDYLFIFLDHLTYHRGQITHAIKLKGYKGVNTDYYDYQEHLAGLK